MFTGIVEELGKISAVNRRGESAVLKVGCSKVINGTNLGDSIAVNGVCLTVTGMDANSFSADISYETLRRSSFDGIKPGDEVNLERALTLETRLGGHMVSGHVDGLGKIEKIVPKGDSYVLTVEYPEELDKYIADKGSITIDGTSLTVINENGRTFDVAVIPHTLTSTVLKNKNSGSKVNLEVDVVARYLDKLLKKSGNTDKLKDKIVELGSFDY